MGTMYVVKRVLGSITSVLKGPGSASPLEVENNGTLPVNVYFKTTNPGDTQVASATPMPVSLATAPALAEGIVDDAAFGVATSKVLPIGALADETSPDSVGEGDIGALRMTLDRILWVALRGKNAASADTELKLLSGGQVVIGGVDADMNDLRYGRFKGNTDGQTAQALLLADGKAEYNGATWDRVRNNISATLLASAARTVETNSADQVNYNGRALLVIVNVSAITDTPILTPKLAIKDSISGNYFTVWTAAATITATGTYAYLFDLGGMGGAGSFTEAVNIRVGRTWRFTMAVADADSATYSVSADVLL